MVAKSVRLLVLFAALTSGVQGAIYYVDDDAVGDSGPGDPSISDPFEDGTCLHPYDAIQEAVTRAAPGDEVHIYPGTYTGIGNHEIDPQGKSIKITSISGAESVIIDCQEGARGFNFISGETAQTIIDQLTIRNGNAVIGGAVLCQKSIGDVPSSPTIQYCRFEDNIALSGGGAIACDTSDPTISECYFSYNQAVMSGYNYGGGAIWGILAEFLCSNCTFDSNSGDYGGAVLLVQSSPSISGCSFTGNSAYTEGGAIGCFQQSLPTLIGNSFYNNSAASGGGAIVIAEECISVLIFSCTFDNNTAVGEGGAIRVANSVVNTAITSCVFTANSVANSVVFEGRGGAIYGEGDSITSINNSTLSYNQSSNDGGSIYLLACSTELSGCIFLANQAGYNGGAIYVNDLSPLIVQCQFQDNHATDKGGGIYCGELGSPSISSCAFYGNTADRGGGCISFNGDLLVGNTVFDGCEVVGPSARGGAIWGASFGQVGIHNCLVVNSFAEDSGSAIVAEGCLVQLNNCTISNNESLSESGGSVASQGSAVFFVQNSILYFNSPTSFHQDGGDILASYSDIEFGWDGDGNLDCDPQFVIGVWGNYYLDHIARAARLSCGVDAGNGDASAVCYWDGASQTCMNQRTTRNDQVKDSAGVDLGYHYPYPTPSPTPTATPIFTPGSSPTPNCTHDGDVNFDDFVTAGDAQMAFAIAVGIITPGFEQRCASDCNADGDVTAGDAQRIFETAVGLNFCADLIRRRP